MLSSLVCRFFADDEIASLVEPDAILLADLSDLLVPVFAVLMSLFHVGLLAFKVSDLFLVLQNSVLHHHKFLLLESDGLLDITG